MALVTLALSVYLSPSLLAQTAFTPTGVYSAGLGTQFVLAQDLNADAKVDLVVVNNRSNSISILAGNGAGGFSQAVSYTVGVGPVSAAIADLNGDRRLDIAVACRGANSVQILRNNGGLTYVSAGMYAAGTYLAGIQAADLNGDGRPDLAVTNLVSNTVGVLTNSGTAFSAPRTYVTGSGPNSVAIADFNRDGRPDIATANQNGQGVSVLLNVGGGLFGPAGKYIGAKTPYAIAAADVNGDGRLDLLTADNAWGGFDLFVGKGDGTFNAAMNNGARGPCDGNTSNLNTTFLTTGDLNADGHTDVVVANLGTKDMRVVLGHGNGTFQWPAVVLAIDAAPYGVAAADLSGDGRDDLAYVSGANQVVSLVNVSPMAAGLTLEAPTVANGRYTVAHLTLSDPAPLGGSSVKVTASNPASVIVPDVVVVPAGGKTVSFVVAAKAAGTTQIAVSVNGIRSVPLTIY